MASSRLSARANPRATILSVASPKSSAEAQLDPRRFARVHRSAIISLSAVREVQPWFRGEYVALPASGAKVRIGAAYRDGFSRDSRRSWIEGTAAQCTAADEKLYRACDMEIVGPRLSLR